MIVIDLTKKFARFLLKEFDRVLTEDDVYEAEPKGKNLTHPCARCALRDSICKPSFYKRYDCSMVQFVWKRERAPLDNESK